jgi:phosphatidylglycerol:prolipoprotein diacylglycerol transferase
MTYIWNLDPIAFSVFGLSVHWYGITYVLDFLIFQYLGWKLIQYIVKNYKKTSLSFFNQEKFENIVFYGFIFGVLGGRLGYFLFYNLATFWIDPLEIFKVWHGGMSIHGGILAVLIFGYFWTKKNKVKFWEIADVMMIPLAFSLFLGRIANFVNGELVGIKTDQSWGVIFPHIDNFLRHPSQLYESSKNLFLASLLLFFFFKLRKYQKHGFLTAVFIGGYGILRFLIEYVREREIGQDQWIFSMGQYLCIVMIIFALTIFINLKRSKK